MKVLGVFDPASLAVIALTFVLFGAAVLVKGVGHDLLLEAGVFLVSAKLILQQVKSAELAADTKRRLEEIRAAVARVEGRLPNESPAAGPPA